MACPKPVRSLPLLFTHGPRPQTFLQAAAWPTKLFLWASEGNVRHPRARPSNAPRQPAGLPRPLCGLSEVCLFSSPTGPARKRFCRPQLGPQSFFYGLPKATRPLCGLSEACLFSSPTGPARKRFCRPQLGPQSFFYGLPKATLDTHGPGPQTLLGSRQACPGLSVTEEAIEALRPFEIDIGPECRAPSGWPVRSLSEACLFSSPTGPARKRFCRPQLGPQSFFYGLPKATLDTHGPGPQTLLGSRQACPGLSVAGPKPVRSLPLLFTHGPRPQTFLQAAAWPTKLFLWASEGNVRHPRARPSNAPRQPAGLPRPLCGLSEACPKLASSHLLFTHGSRPQTFLQAAAWPTKLFLWASEGNVRHPRARPSNAPRQPAGLPRPLCGLSEACPKFASSLHPRAPPANVSAGRSLAHKAFSMGFRRQR